ARKLGGSKFVNARVVVDRGGFLQVAKRLRQMILIRAHVGEALRALLADLRRQRVQVGGRFLLDHLDVGGLDAEQFVVERVVARGGGGVGRVDLLLRAGDGRQGHGAQAKAFGARDLTVEPRLAGGRGGGGRPPTTAIQEQAGEDEQAEEGR